MRETLLWCLLKLMVSCPMLETVSVEDDVYDVDLRGDISICFSRAQFGPNRFDDNHVGSRDDRNCFDVKIGGKDVLNQDLGNFWEFAHALVVEIKTKLLSASENLGNGSNTFDFGTGFQESDVSKFYNEASLDVTGGGRTNLVRKPLGVFCRTRSQTKLQVNESGRLVPQDALAVINEIQSHCHPFTDLRLSDTGKPQMLLVGNGAPLPAANCWHFVFKDAEGDKSLRELPKVWKDLDLIINRRAPLTVVRAYLDDIWFWYHNMLGAKEHGESQNNKTILNPRWVRDIYRKFMFDPNRQKREEAENSFKADGQRWSRVLGKDWELDDT